MAGRLSLNPFFLLKTATNSLKKLNAEFWVGHAIVLISTVAGVYLAASAGLDTALEFENIRYDRDNLYLRTSLRDESLHNVQDIEKIIDRARRLNVFPKEDTQGRRLRYYFIYDSLLQNPNVLNTPSKMIIGIQHFYNEVEHTLDEGVKRNLSYGETARRLETIVTEYKSTILPVFNQDIDLLQQSLQHTGIRIE